MMGRTKEQLLKWYLTYPIFKSFLNPVIDIKRMIAQKKCTPMQEVVKSLRSLLVQDPVIRVDEFQGIFAVDSHSDLFERIVLDNKYEPVLVRYCKKLINKNRDVIDVGANVGFFTVMFAKNICEGKKVLSIEPTRKALKRLYRNIEQNHVQENVIIFEGVASNITGSVEIKTIDGKEEYSSLGVMDHPAISKEEYVLEEVKSLTVDGLVKEYSLDPGFMKVDVEGAEYLVFEGAQCVMETKRPVILSELSDYLLKQNGSSSQEVMRMVEKYEYDIIDPLHPSIPAGQKDFGDILCVPKELNFDASNL